MTGDSVFSRVGVTFTAEQRAKIMGLTLEEYASSLIRENTALRNENEAAAGIINEIVDAKANAPSMYWTVMQRRVVEQALAWMAARKER